MRMYRLVYIAVVGVMPLSRGGRSLEELQYRSASWIDAERHRNCEPQCSVEKRLHRTRRQISTDVKSADVEVTYITLGRSVGSVSIGLMLCYLAGPEN